MPRYSSRTGQLLEYQTGPFDSTHIYVQWGGKLYNGSEFWSCGFRMWKAGGSAPSDATSILAPVSAAIAAYHARPGSSINPLAKLSFVKVNAVGTDGHYQAQSTTQALFADVAGGGASYPLVTPPNQVAWAVSLVTGYSRGPAHRGRFFNPLPCVQVGSDGRVDPQSADNLALSANQLRADVNQGGGEQMVVMSRKAGAPGHRAVTGMEVGRVYDTQRRRRRSLAEDYQTGT